MFMPEHLSGTGECMESTGVNNFIPGTLYTEEDRDSLDYWLFSGKFGADREDSKFETDPIKQIKMLREELDTIGNILHHLQIENDSRDQREKYIIFGLVGVASLVLVSFFKR
ncbi:unnamed protein product [Caenorhabditis angaria]|uniref:Uncharacterized protein n=1 Tax=Caenorhabditis angaria TaxID=860376 RepID=A0A9P1NCR1_9PELO|nr:unnamed protein product [Caenorhabditis angaria]